MTAVVSAPRVIRAIPVIVAAACVAIIAALLSSGSSYLLKLSLHDANGLRPGSQVLLGGIPVGSVSSLRLAGHAVIANLDLDPSRVRVGAGARANIVAANLLGQMNVALAPGDPRRPLRSGTTLPESAVGVPTQLDQIADVLDAPTRTALSVLIDEAGVAVSGQRSDIGALLHQLPVSLGTATHLLDQLVQDNHTLADVIQRADGFVTSIDDQTPSVRHVIDAGAAAAQTLAQKSDQLRDSVSAAPAALTTARAFLTHGTSTLQQLTPLLPGVASSADQLNRLLVAVKPFTVAAVPSLDRAATVAPDLSRLASRATPTISAAIPTFATLANIAKLAAPLSTWLGLSSQDLFNIFAGWSRAIQYRDGLGHLFHGNLFLDPEIVLKAADRGATAAQKRQNLLDVLKPGLLRAMGLLGAYNRAKALATTTSSPGRTQSGRVLGHPTSSPRSGSIAPEPATTTPGLGATGAEGSLSGRVQGLLGGVLGALGLGRSGSAGSSTETGGSTGSSGAQPGTSITPSQGQAGSLRHLLDYLFGK